MCLRRNIEEESQKGLANIPLMLLALGCKISYEIFLMWQLPTCLCFFNMAQQSLIEFDNYLAYSNKHSLDLPNLNDVGIFLLRKLPRQIWMDSLVTLPKGCKA